MYQVNSSMNAAEPLSRPRSRGLVQLVVDSLTSSIDGGSIAIGAKLPSEAEIMRQFEVSRTVVREAISRLQASQLVETRHGIGTFVQSMKRSSSFQLAAIDLETRADVLEIFELRVSVETEAAALAAQRRTAEHIQTMRTTLDTLRRCIEQRIDAVSTYFQFHKEIAKATGNHYFVNLMGLLGSVIIPGPLTSAARNAAKGQIQSMLKVQVELEGIFNAICNQESDVARAAMRTHLSNSKDRLIFPHDRRRRPDLPRRQFETTN